MTEWYDWKTHFADPLVKTESGGDGDCYSITNETGSGAVRELALFPGVQVIWNDLHLRRCGAQVPERADVIEINFCVEGRYQCDVNENYCFLVTPGVLSVGTVGRREARGFFPTGHFRGITLFIETEVFGNEKELLGLFGINLANLQALSRKKQRYFSIRRDPGIAGIFLEMYPEDRLFSRERIRLKTMEILQLLSEPEMAAHGTEPVHISKVRSELAERVQTRIAQELGEHVTVEQLSEELHISPSTLKSTFKKVYGVPIFTYQKTLRLEEARRLLCQTKLPISEICFTVGYQNAGKFAAAFRQCYGLTPAEYRKRIRLEQA